MEKMDETNDDIVDRLDDDATEYPTEEQLAAKAKASGEPKKKGKTKAKVQSMAGLEDAESAGRSGSRWRVQVRHSPCPLKRLDVVADSEAEAVDAFWEANIKAVAKHKKVGERLVVLIDKHRKQPGSELTVTQLARE